MKEIRVGTASYDIAGNGIGRMLHQCLLQTAIPIGNDGEPHRNALTVCRGLHRLGRPLCFLALLFDRTVTTVYRYNQERTNNRRSVKDRRQEGRGKC
jgi:hypothetical protein